MPNIISKILHRKSRSGSSSPSSPTSPSSTGLVASRDRAGASTIRLDDRFDADGSPISPGSPESRRKSMSAARSNPTSPTAPARKSLDARPNGIYVNPARPAPPPPVPEARSHRPNGTTDVDGTVVIDGRADPRNAGRVESETTAGLFPSPPMHELDRTSEANGGQFDRRGLFDDTPAASVALDHQHFSSSPASHPIHDSPATREAVVPPGPVSLDLDRELPPLPRNPSHEIKQVDSRRRPTMSETGQRQSVEAELGREPSSDMVDGERERERERERGSRLSDGRGMERSIDEEGSHLLVVNGKERASLDIPERGSSLRNAELGASDNNGSIRSGAGRAGHGVGAVPYSTPTTGSVERQMAGLAIRDDPKRALLAGGMVPLEAQRLGLVRSVVDESEKRRLQRGALSEQGLRTFEAAGMSHLVGKASTVDVTTQWLKPVVHETIINRIHTEYLTIINREIHKHHIYPKIQPIEDPNPIVLPPLHRIFSPVTGKWHEVQGDDAAIAILGEDVFRNGPKEVRHVRKPVTDDVLRAESEGAMIPPVGPDGKGLSTVAPATQLGGARVVEREGILGGEMGEWKKTDHAHLFGRLKEEIGKAL